MIEAGFGGREEESSPPPRRRQGIVLAIVLVMIFALITAVYTFQRKAIIDATVSRNRLDASEADALAKGGLRLAEALVAIVRAKHVAAATGSGGDAAPTESGGPGLPSGGTAMVDALWQGIENFPLEFEGDRRLQIEIEDEGTKLNLNALVAAQPSDPENDDLVLPDDPDDEPDSEDGGTAEEDAVEYLTSVLDYIVDGMEGSAEDKNYDTAKIAENLLDFIDGDSIAINGRSEDEYYRRQDPPYTAWNRPFVTIDQVGLVEDVDAALLSELRHYMTVHPIGSATGINLNRAEPWVLKLVYSGTSGNRRLIDDKMVEDLMALRKKGEIVCDDVGASPECVSRSDVGNGDFGNGDIYPPVSLPGHPAVFRVVASAQVGEITRRFEAVYDTRAPDGPQLLSWRRLRGND